MRTLERISCSRFPVESITLPGPADVARRATATDAAPRIVFVICVLAVAARLILINQPYVDHRSWRQSDVAAIARNCLQNGFRFVYPQIRPNKRASGACKRCGDRCNGILDLQADAQKRHCPSERSRRTRSRDCEVTSPDVSTSIPHDDKI